jgi:hypothetical protein
MPSGLLMYLQSASKLKSLRQKQNILTKKWLHPSSFRYGAASYRDEPFGESSLIIEPFGESSLIIEPFGESSLIIEPFGESSLIIEPLSSRSSKLPPQILCNI